MKKSIVLGLIILLPAFIQAQFWKTSDPEKLSSKVNSEGEEGTLVLSPDGTAIYLSRTFYSKNKGGENDQDIWFSEITDDRIMTEAASIKSLNNKFNNAVVGINAAGDRLYILNSYDVKKNEKKGINVVERSSDGKWGEPTNVEIPDLNIQGDFYGFYVTPDEKTIVISYQGPNTVGKEDLYVSEYTNGKWSSPLSLGNKVNSAGFEMSPFLSADKDTLYFSSNGFGGLGDADIFYSVKKGAWTEWSTPVNLGTPFNSEKFDAYFLINNNAVYWTSNRENKYSDIYRVDVLSPPPLEIICSGTDLDVYGANNGSATVTINEGVAPYSYKWSNNDDQATARNLTSGSYTVLVTDDLGRTAECQVTIDEPEALELSVKLMFDYNQNKPNNSDLNTFLENLTEYLQQGKNSIIVNIESSASKVRTSSFKNNKELAKSRADQAAVLISDYFKEKGLLNKIEINITETSIQGPEYKGDFENKEKYNPFQYVKLSVQ